jgi:ATP/maltotriose-dependent transcriptional regulator MalT
VDRAEGALRSEAFADLSLSPPTAAQESRLRAQIVAARGEAERAEQSFKVAAATFHEYGAPFYAACTELEYAEWLDSQGRAHDAATLLPGARETFERLRATPWLERAGTLLARLPAEVAAAR